MKLDPYRPFLLLAAAICFGLGISLSIMKFEHLWIFEEPVSLLGLVHGLWLDGSIALAIIVTLVSIVFPTAKLAMATQAIYDQAHLPGWARFLANWSMMDVLLVAIVIFAAKTSGLTSAMAQPGLWFYALATVLTVLATTGINGKSNPGTNNNKTP